MVRRTLPEAHRQSGAGHGSVRWGVRRATAVLIAATLLAACTGGKGSTSHRASHAPTPTATSDATGGTVTNSCPSPPPYAIPPQNRPRYSLGVTIDLARGMVDG